MNPMDIIEDFIPASLKIQSDSSKNENRGPVEISGFLYRQSSKLLYKTWTKRYAELKGNVITYYSLSKGQPLGEIVLSNRMFYSESSIRHFCFCLTNTSTSESNYFAAETATDKEAWADKIRVAILRSKLQSQRHAKSIPNVSHHSEANKEYLNRPILYIKVIKARNLLAKDLNGFSDPFVNVYVGNSAMVTTVQKKTLNPEWGMVFSFDMHRSYRYAKLDVWDKDRISNDELGTALIPLLPLREGSNFRGWFPLLKKSSKSSAGGEIEIEISLSGDPDSNHYSWHFFRCLRMLPELQMNILNFDTKDGDYTHLQEFGTLPGEGFPFYFPPIQTELLEDFSIRVQLNCVNYGTRVSVRGVLLLTNYRLIFITLTRIMSSHLPYDLSISNALSRGSLDLTTQIPLGCICSVHLTTDTDGGNSIYEVIKIKTTDHRSLSFVLRDDIEYQIAPWSPSGPDGFNIIDKKTMASTNITSQGIRAVAPSPTAIDSESVKKLTNEDRIQHGYSFSSPVQSRLSEDNNELNLSDRVKALESAWMNLISEASYNVDQSDSDEGSPFTRIYQRLSLFVANRHIEQKKMSMVHSDLISVLHDTHSPRRSSKRSVRISNPVYIPKKNDEVNNDIDNDQMDLDQKDIDGEEPPADLPMGWSKEKEIQRLAPQTDEIAEEINASLTSYIDRVKALPLASLNRLQSYFTEGWKVYDAQSEFSRMGVPDTFWRISLVNSLYETCPSYPRLLVVPNNVGDEVLIGSASFRSKGRIPTMVWRSTVNQCTISRCSQPLVGITQSRNANDELLVQSINFCGGSYARERRRAANPLPITSMIGKPILIVDARPLLNATANQAAGKGTENEKNYDNSQVAFMEIANIHAVRKSLEVLEDACANEDHWLKNLDASGWFSITVKILRAAVKIVYAIALEERSVLVHCSDGWDRTAQLTSLSMLLLDPYYRTLRGFIVLIEKEWMSFGHKFGDRLGWAKGGFKDEEASPVFQQFLECVFQCQSQSPNVYEFNEDLLLFLMEHAHSGWFSNFLFNCERERNDASIEKSSISIWTVILQQADKFINKSFQSSLSVVIPVTTKHRMVVWSRWYFRWHERIWISGWVQSSTVGSYNIAAADESFRQPTVDEQTVMQSATLIPTNWADDKSAKACVRCSKSFGFVRRKHHCRACGQIFCEQCCSEQRIVPNISSWKTSRTCMDCACKIDSAELCGVTLNSLTAEDSPDTNALLDEETPHPLYTRNAVKVSADNDEPNTHVHFHEEGEEDALLLKSSGAESKASTSTRRRASKSEKFHRGHVLNLDGIGEIEVLGDGELYLRPTRRRSMSFSSLSEFADTSNCSDNISPLESFISPSHSLPQPLPVRKQSGVILPMTSIVQYKKKIKDQRDQDRSKTPPPRTSPASSLITARESTEDWSTWNTSV